MVDKMKNQKAKVNLRSKTQKNANKAALKILDIIKKNEKKTNNSDSKVIENTNKFNKSHEVEKENLDDLLKEVKLKSKLTSKMTKKPKGEDTNETKNEQLEETELTNKEIKKSSSASKILATKQLLKKRKTIDSEVSEAVDHGKKKVKKMEVKPQKVKTEPNITVNQSNKSMEKLKVLPKKEMVMKKEKKSKVKKSTVGKKEKVMGNLELTIKGVEKAFDVILQLVEKEKQENKTLLPFEDNPIFLQINCIKVPKVPRRRLRILLPNNMIGQNDDVALIVPDLERGRRKDYEKTIEHWETKLCEKGITRIKSVIPMNQVKTEYNQYEMRRKFARLYDFFLVDGRIAGHMTHLLGKTFTRSATPPVPIKAYRDNLKEEIENALKKATLEIHGHGPCHTVQVATLSMTQKKIVKNIYAAAEQLKTLYPGGLDNIRSILVKTKNSLAIPIFYSIKQRNEVPVPKIKPERPKAFETVEGELTTLESDVKVRVTPRGNVKIISIKEENESDEEDEANKGMAEIAKDDPDSEDHVDKDSEDENDDEEKVRDKKIQVNHANKIKSTTIKNKELKVKQELTSEDDEDESEDYNDDEEEEKAKMMQVRKVNSVKKTGRALKNKKLVVKRESVENKARHVDEKQRISMKKGANSVVNKKMVVKNEVSANKLKKKILKNKN